MSTTTLLTIATFIGFASYFPLNHRQHVRYPTLPIDKKIPTIPIFIVPYGLFKPFVAAGFIFLLNTSLYPQFITTLFFGVLTCVTSWIIYPTGVKRQPVPAKNIFDKTLNLVYHHDGDANGLPSAHVVYTIISFYFLSLRFPGNTLSLLIIATLICLSTIFTKQHYLLDLLVGIAVGLACLLLVPPIFA